MGEGGLGLGAVIFLIFLVLKLLEVDPVAGWSWFWVFSPLLIGLAFWLVVVVFIIVLAIILE